MSPPPKRRSPRRGQPTCLRAPRSCHPLQISLSASRIPFNPAPGQIGHDAAVVEGQIGKGDLVMASDRIAILLPLGVAVTMTFSTVIVQALYHNVVPGFYVWESRRDIF